MTRQGEPLLCCAAYAAPSDFISLKQRKTKKKTRQKAGSKTVISLMRR